MSERMFTVNWAIDVWAETPEEAAKKALEIQRDRGSCATFFSAYDYENDIAVDVDVDLDEGQP